MIHARAGHTATRLLDGRVLITGGIGSEGLEAEAELYDPSTGSFAPTGRMLSPRVRPTSTRLEDGRVLIAGGMTRQANLLSATAELYDPSTGSFTPTGAMTEPRTEHAGTLLLDGRVLVVGGLGDDIDRGLTSAELYDPSTGTWGATVAPTSTRQTFYSMPLQTALLLDGRVLVAGGSEDPGHGETPPAALSGIDLYDPGSGTFEPIASMTVGRICPSITSLSDGRVLIAGGLTGVGAEKVKCCWQLQALRSAEIDDPSMDRSVATGPLRKARAGHTAVLLDDGDVLVIGGQGAEPTRRAERFHP